MPLAHQHWAGTKSYRRHEPFNPMFERYHQCNQMGMFQLFTGRDQEKLVAYFGCYLAPSMHSQKLMLTEDTFYIHPDYRGGRNALRFLKHIEEKCREWRVHEIMFSCEIDNETGIKGLLKLLDFSPVIEQYSKTFVYPPADSGASLEEAPADVRPIATPRS